MSHLKVITNKPVAFDSPDHLQPWGTARDNSVNLSFNRKLLWWIPASRLRVLDLGCADGGFVKSILDMGGFAVGIEGSDYSKVRKRAEWATIPNYLFTADITEPFRVVKVDEKNNKQLIKFNVITAWEVMEHIHRDKLRNVFENISRHLMPKGVVIMSISQNEDVIDGVELHQTVENMEWWLSKFLEFGYMPHAKVLAYFGDDWVRGGDNAPGSFHVVATRKGDSLLFKHRLRLLTLIALPYNVVMRSIKFLRRVTPRPVKQVYRRIYEGLKR